MEFRASDLFKIIGTGYSKYDARVVESIKDFYIDELTGNYVKNSYLIVTGGEPDTISKFSINKLKTFAYNWGYHVLKDECENVYRFKSLSSIKN